MGTAGRLDGWTADFFLAEDRGREGAWSTSWQAGLSVSSEVSWQLGEASWGGNWASLAGWQAASARGGAAGRLAAGRLA